jgi:dihydroxyacid dehydratase/phosphogluconate dehydratase
MAIRDEAFLGMIDTCIAEQGASEETVEDLDKDIVHKAGQCFLLLGATSMSLVCMQ